MSMKLTDYVLADAWDNDFIGEGIALSYNNINLITNTSPNFCTDDQGKAIAEEVRARCHNLMNKRFNYGNSVILNDLANKVLEVVCDKTRLLVDAYRGMNTAADLVSGRETTDVSANPTRGTKTNITMNSRVQKYNDFDNTLKRMNIQKEYYAKVLDSIAAELQSMLIQYTC